MKYIKGDIVKYTGKKDEIHGLKNGMKGLVLKVEEQEGLLEGDYWTEVHVNFDKLERDRLIMTDSELELVKRKADLIKVRKLRVLDRVLAEDGETGDDVVVVVSKLKYSFLDDTITVTGHREDDKDITYAFRSDVDAKVALAR